MKKIISKMLILLFLLNLIAPFSVFAANDITIYNCEKIVTLDYGIEQFYDKNYIYEKDIENINLYITSKSIITSVGNVDMKLYPGSSIVVVNGTSITYPNATVETDDGLYISIELLAMFFSEIYEVSDTVIKLWISDTGYDFARGIISLPSDEVAPTGGIEIEVFVAEKPTTTLSSGITIADSNYELAQIGTPGYSKNEKPMYDDGSKTYNAFLDYEKKVSDVVVIPEGKNNVEYTLSIQCDDFEKCIVAYYTEIEGNPFYGKLNYAGTDILYNFTLSNSKPTINGMISIPTNAKSDVKFRVIAHGKSYNYIYDGVISMGEKTAQYSVAVDKNSTYSVELIFIDSEYSRVLSDEKIYVGTDSIYGMNLATEVANKYIANISLPDDYNEDINNIYLEVYLQMATSPYYVLDVQSVSLNQYTRNASVVLYDDIESKNVRIAEDNGICKHIRKSL